MNDIARLPEADWYPIEQADQSRYVEDVCEACAQTIKARERHIRRYWKKGPAEVKQHIECPPPGGAR